MRLTSKGQVTIPQEIRDQLDRSGLGPVSVRRVVPSLEDVFVSLTGEGFDVSG